MCLLGRAAVATVIFDIVFAAVARALTRDALGRSNRESGAEH